MKGCLCRQNWVNSAPKNSEDFLERVCRELGVSRAFGQILAARNLRDVGDAERFLRPGEQEFHPPLLMRDMEKAVERIHRALADYEKILIFGDYDVDGTASASILFSYLKRLGGRVQYFIPHRLQDGYGFTPAVIAKFRGWGTDLLITTDHGSTAVEGARLVAQAGMDIIITDHHRLGKTRPHCTALINPQQEGCSYPFKELSAAGVVFKLICALDDCLEENDFFNRRGVCRTSPNYYLDLVALATVADMTPLVGENRTLVKLGLEMMNTHPRPGLSGLIKECRIKGEISPSVISFKLAPKINALGRIGDPRVGVRLLLSHSHTESRRLARQMVGVNHERRAIEQEVLAMAAEQVDADGDLPAHVLVGGDWHPGVMGSIATRLAFQTGKPIVVLTLHVAGQAIGSARSRRGGNLLNLLAACEPLLNRFGGHPSAAGLSLDPENLDAFKQRFYEAVVDAAETDPRQGPDNLEIEAWITPEMLTRQFFDEVERLSPFGHCNPEPVVAMREMRVSNFSGVPSRHLKFSLCCTNGQKIDATAWDHPEWDLADAHIYDVAFVPQIQNGANGPTHQLKVVDMIRRA